MSSIVLMYDQDLPKTIYIDLISAQSIRLKCELVLSNNFC